MKASRYGRGAWRRSEASGDLLLGKAVPSDTCGVYVGRRSDVVRNLTIHAMLVDVVSWP